MNSSRLKWFLIVIFLAVNIFFLFQYKNYSNLLKFYTEKEISSATEILNKRGIPITHDAIPNDKTVDDILKIEYPDNVIERLADQIMQEDFASYVLPTGISYTNDLETLVFYDRHRFEYKLENVSLPNESELNELSAVTSKSSSSYARILSERLFHQPLTSTYKTSLKPISFIEKDGSVILKVQQEINGTPIDTSSITAVFHDKKIVYIQGNIYIATEATRLYADSHDIINMLFKINKSDKEIVEIKKVYSPVETNNDSLYLTPSYMLVYENGEVHVWDATSSAQRY